MVAFCFSNLIVRIPNACVSCFTMPMMSVRSTVSSRVVCIPNVMLKTVVKASNDRLNVCHVNAGAIYPKIDEFRYVFDGFGDMV